MKAESRRLGYFQGWLSVVLNTALFVLKYAVGLGCGSVAMIADAWHTLSDTLTSVILLVGLKISAARADRKHPFGHGRAEVVCALIIGVILGFVGLAFLHESILRLVHDRPANFGPFALAVFGVSAVLKEAMARYAIWGGRKIGAASLVADGWHHRSDAIASLLIVLGALIGRRLWWIDGVMGIGVSLLIVYAAYDIVRNAIDPLLGEALEEEVEKRICEIALRVAPAAKGLHHFHLHRYGDHREVTFHLRLPPETDLATAHRTADEIEHAVRGELQLDATIHVEPVRKET